MKKKFNWTIELEEELKRLWNKMSLYKMAKHFHTTEDNLKKKAKELGLEEYQTNRWTKEEEENLRKWADKYVTDTICKKLGKSKVAVQKKALKMGVILHSKKDPWEKWMIDYLKDNINKIPIGKISEMLGLSYHNILVKCKELGINYVKESWTEDEINILRKWAPKVHYTELVKVLPNRTIGAITGKAYELGIELVSLYAKLSEEDILYLKTNWGKKPAMEIARNLKVSIGTIYSYKKKLNLPNVGQRKKWTKETIEMLKKDAKTMNRQELAKKYETSVSQISSIASKHNITLINSRFIWNDELDKLLLEYVNNKLEISEMSARLHINVGTIKNHLKYLGVDLKRGKRISWTKDEEKLLIDLWGNIKVEEISEKLQRTVSAITNRAFILGLGSQIENNYDGLKIQDIEELFKVSRMTILTTWVSLGLKLDYRRISNQKVYAFVQINNLLEFLHKNENLWDSRVLEKDILGEEPNWLIEKRKRDIEENFELERTSLNKQKLFLENMLQLNIDNNESLSGFEEAKLVRSKNKKKK